MKMSQYYGILAQIWIVGAMIILGWIPGPFIGAAIFAVFSILCVIDE